MDKDVVIQAGRAIGGRSCKNIHLHSGKNAISERGEVGVAGPGKVLCFGTNEVVAKATAPEVIQLKIASQFGEAKFVQAIMVSVRPDEHVYHLAVTIAGERGGITGRRDARSRIVWKVEHPERRADGPRSRIDAVWAHNVQPGINVVAGGGVGSIRNPSGVVECRPFTDESDQGPPDGGTLN